MMIDNSEKHRRAVLDVSAQLDAIAQRGFSLFDDDGSVLLNGVVRDCAFRLRNAVEVEMKSHLAKEPLSRGMGD